MGELSNIAGYILIAIGAFFYVVGAIGIYRMPDVFTRMHAASVSETLGVGFLLIGMMFLAGLTLVSVKLAIILGVILFTSPIATHALAQAALHEGIKPYGVGNEVLVGPGAHEGPEKIGKTTAASAPKKRRKTTTRTASRKKPATRTAKRSGATTRKRRTRS